jgi:mono/diheme cytochrome c family protein
VLSRLIVVRRDRAWPAAVTIALVGVLAFGGCDLQENADTDRGRQLFTAKCAQCHTLAEAAAKGELGPNLDDAFRAARAKGMDDDTIEGVVQAQIANPRPASPQNTNLYMPPDLVTGSDAEDVAAYVASVAGVPGIGPPQVPGPPGAQVFADNGCGSCHTLKAAGATGTVGPVLDDVLPGQSATKIEQDITDPNAVIAPGFPPNVMPQNYQSTIDSADLNALVEYLVQCAGTSDPACTK